MKLQASFTGKRPALLTALFSTGVLLSLISPGSAQASLIVSVQSVIAQPGSSGNGFDVQLNNTGPAAVTIAAFSFGVSVSNVNIQFTDANTSTVSASYIFGNNSLFGPDLTGVVSGQSLTTSDVFATPNAGVILGSGATVGLARLIFAVSPGATAGTFPVALSAFPTTSLADPSAVNLPALLTSGQITIGTPEPSTVATLAGGAIFFALLKTLRARNKGRSSGYGL